MNIDPCLEKRLPDEPMFVLLGRDSAAPAAIEAWCVARESEILSGKRALNSEELAHIRQVRQKVSEFNVWRSKNR